MDTLQESPKIRSAGLRVVGGCGASGDPLLWGGLEQRAGAQVQHPVRDAKKFWVTVPGVVRYTQTRLCDRESGIHATLIADVARGLE